MDARALVALDAADRALQSRLHFPRLPPADFQPLAAADRDLALHGFPPRPDPDKQPQLFELWESVVSAGHRHVRARPIADFRVRPFDRALPVLDNKFGAKNFGGASVLPHDVGTAGEPAVFGSGCFFVPQIAASAPLLDEVDLSIWVGMDADFAPEYNGYMPDRVLQAGVKAILKPNADVEYRAFFEWNVTGYYTPAQYVDGFPVSPNDRIRVLICASEPNRGQIYLYNESQDVTTSIGIDATPGFPALGSSIQWAVEASMPPGANWAPFLANFNAVWWADCQAGTRNHDLPLARAKPTYAINPSGTHLTDTIFLPNGLVVVWKGPG